MTSGTGGISPKAALAHARGLLGTSPARAELQARHVLKVLPEDARALCIIAAARRLQGELEVALGIARQVVSARPDLAMAHLELGQVLIVRGEAPAALEAFRNAARLQPDAVDWGTVTGDFLLAGEAAGAAQARAEQLRRLYGREDVVVACDALRAQRPRDAAAILRQARQATPADAPALHVLGLAEFALGDGEQAEACLAASLDAVPDAGVRFDYARVLAAACKPQAALDQLAWLGRAEPVVLLLTAQCALQVGDTARAGELAASLVRAFPGLGRLWWLQGEALQQCGRLAEAEAAFERARALRHD